MIAQPSPPPKRWISKPFPDSDDQQLAIQSLTQSLGISPFLAALLVQRGVTTYNEARVFFRPEISHLHNPFDMKDMDRAIMRLQMAMLPEREEKILIYGDYDVDGTTSVALVYSFLKNYHSKIDYYIPDRYKEGYGISRQGIEWAAENGFSLIIALDCGIKSIERVAEAKALGVDFIICDHHRPGDELPDAAAVLDPKRNDCVYPYKELSGCGVGFKLLQAFCMHKGIELDILYPCLDLVAISIASDIVPLTGENRVLAYYGLKYLNSAPRTGVKALIKIAGFSRELDITNLVFGLGPRINAAGRIQHAKAAVQLLLAESEEEADEFAMAINKHNNSRREFDSSITEQALAMIRESDVLTHAKSTVLYDASWHKGVIGIVASRCIEHFHRPTIILTQSNNKAAGSARSVPGFDVYEAIEACSDLLEQFGGHTFAAGMTMPVDNIDAFRRKFEEVVSRTIKEEHLTPLIDIDLPLDFSEINDKLVRIVKQMGPFGPHNLQPTFMSDDVYLVGEPIIMKDKHLKMSVKQGRSGHTLTAIGFGYAHLADQIRVGKPFSICYQVEQNFYNGNVSLQLMLKDLKCS
ncbi:single-stranded-DNA-specific exonuclease RecJ [Spirosoma sp. KCTC 42546]|uniref:single-stranded-DNA-specific exonuclease RecJ n=1 Tax=Spirosoma sp. KCTC 42546 TaxID=2520506 RepID=UPI00115A9C0C|nr:single-stranded-DNA-specific exonuclease RecJ [Spirosoma sp. KCTC 42546]QDK78967.1 single-stranded-DNA-specific exonuclease RecJ [Spirosoma sp. KCTC 42546]